jgi:hypothetical protein
MVPVSKSLSNTRDTLYRNKDVLGPPEKNGVLLQHLTNLLPRIPAITLQANLNGLIGGQIGIQET